ncbi:hypothetical protein [Nonomuraea sp. NPDC049480]|uniref:hypothetical protein n=1 Tax=Nonomuraea sp. NPDC049480 TaxID=3364353 RepID=UPI0037A16FB1
MQRRVVIVVFPGFQPLDLAGPADVFGTAATGVEIVAVRAGGVPAGNGVTVTAGALGEVAGPIDTLLDDRRGPRAGARTAETLCRVFRRHWRISPGDHRRRFQSKEK